MAFLNIANTIRKYTSSSSISNYTNGAGVGVVSGNVYVNKDGSVGLWADKVATTATNVGAKNGATVTAVEKGLGGFLHETTLTLTDLPLTLIDLSNGAGVKIYDFPEGAITILGASGSVTEKTTSTLASTLHTGVTYNWGVGTTTQASATLATTEQDIIPTSNGTASATINVAGAASKGIRTAAPAIFDGSATAKDAFFNVGIATATDITGDATTLWNGTIKIQWMFNGDA